ncbi:hypothetical protein SETIT_8G132900v2 [Setaria italica]|uniref:Mediator complex subunit 15 KIX domain-containing protein n=1 Tax=Setaria italica TaxID=4555 RepID=A0A368S8Y3_SETIT|nr:hypothetical protein SETIT_8G132900v2 [Setaria italica]RCV38320.1 hypothetical protein SETIT_8G132900v2 [Setaria italica]
MDWRTQLHPEARSRIVNKIMEHLPVSSPEGMSELQKVAVRFEEDTYTEATNLSDYLRKISLKLVSMEGQMTNTQQNPFNIPSRRDPIERPLIWEVTICNTKNSRDAFLLLIGYIHLQYI